MTIAILLFIFKSTHNGLNNYTILYNRMIYNVIIIGSGPAGHTAALYLARANLSPLLLEGDSTGEVVSGGLLTTTKIVENYPGFPQGIDGYELTERFKEQSTRFGTTIVSETVLKIEKLEDKLFEVYTSTSTYKTKSIIIATGSTPNRLYIPGYDKFWHKGISTCAVCDGSLPCYRNVPIAVVGGGDSACEEALHLSHTASKVYLIHRRDTLRASKIMIDRVMNNEKIIPIWNSEVVEVLGNKHVEELVLKNTNGETSKLEVRGLFVAIGHTPNSKFVSSFIEIDNVGYIKTNRKMETSVEGVWAVGDVQDPHYRQAITAAGSGCIAALEVERWLN
jgi:thioredoxin reductase (NADPH)